MKNINMFGIGVFCASVGIAAMATPTVGSVTFSQESGSRRVTVSYELSEGPAIVTVDFCTNGVSIGEANCKYVTGDVNKLVENGSHTLNWAPDKAWPNHKITENVVTAVVRAWQPSTPPPYLVVDLSGADVPRYYTSAENVPGQVTDEQYKTDKLLMRLIPAAGIEWRMGSPSVESGRATTGETPHLVTLTQDYFIGVYPVTQRQYARIKGSAPGTSFKDLPDSDRHPVQYVSYAGLRGSTKGAKWPNSDATIAHGVEDGSFIGELRTLTGLFFDLPTDAQWEYACRAGKGSALNSGSNTPAVSADMDAVGWYADNSDSRTHAVGEKQPNAWGLYDMHGNVGEWCLDWKDNSYYDATSRTDPVGAASGTQRVTRGGHWKRPYSQCRSASRDSEGPSSAYNTVGFRLACLIQAAE